MPSAQPIPIRNGWHAFSGGVCTTWCAMHGSRRRSIDITIASCHPGWEIGDLPVLDKPTLMSRFDDWVTDPDVTLEDLRNNFLSRGECVGQLYLGRYLVMTTSGTTGEPAVLLQDRLSWRVYNIVGRTRPQPVVRRIDLAALARRGMRTAALFCDRGHFGAVTLAERPAAQPLLADRTRVLSVLRPVGELVAELNESNRLCSAAIPASSCCWQLSSAPGGFV